MSGYFTGSGIGYTIILTPAEAERLKNLAKGKGTMTIGAIVQTSGDLEFQKRTYDWGTLEFAFTPMMEVVYRALDKEGEEITKARVEVPIKNEKSSDASVGIIARNIGTLVNEMGQSQ